MDRPRTQSSDMSQVQFERKGGVEPTCLVGSMQPMQQVQQHPGHLPTAIRSAWEGLIGSCNPDDVGEVAKFFEKTVTGEMQLRGGRRRSLGMHLFITLRAV
ncbi:unnamed protein product [Cercospora beticola]|nr:unnamed protein product [Cercospora beticola]